MMEIYKELRKNQAAILKESGSDTLYTRRVFADVCVVASSEADRIVGAIEPRKLM
jgi:hypothetical protein